MLSVVKHLDLIIYLGYWTITGSNPLMYLGSVFDFWSSRVYNYPRAQEVGEDAAYVVSAAYRLSPCSDTVNKRALGITASFTSVWGTFLMK